MVLSSNFLPCINENGTFLAIDSLSNLTIECPEIEGYDMESLVWLMYSSGTTGVPKGIVHTHRSLTRMLYGLT